MKWTITYWISIIIKYMYLDKNEFFLRGWTLTKCIKIIIKYKYLDKKKYNIQVQQVRMNKNYFLAMNKN